MSEKCCKTVYDASGFHYWPCDKRAKVERKGKWYCGLHDPERAMTKAQVRARENWKREADENEERRRRLSRYSDAIRLLRDAVKWGGEDADEIEKFLSEEPK